MKELIAETKNLIRAQLKTGRFNSEKFLSLGNNLVTSSKLTPYFISLGITEGTEFIGKYAYSRGYVKFIEDVLCLYYIVENDKDDPTLRDILNHREIVDLFREEEWYDADRVRYAYKKFVLRKYRVLLHNSIGDKEPVELLAEARQMYSNEFVAMKFESGKDLLKYLKDHFVWKSSVVSCSILNDLLHDPDIIDYINKNKEIIIDELIKYDVSRKLIKIPMENPVSMYKNGYKGFDSYGEFLKNILGISLYELHWKVIEHQNNIENKIDTMVNGRLFDHIECDEDVSIRGTITENEIDPKIMNLAERLSSIHGPVSITREASGVHIYIADPDLLKIDGPKELTSKHLAINADKYFGLGKFDDETFKTRENRIIYDKYRMVGKEVPCAMSMKTMKPYYVRDLLSYRPLKDRFEQFKDVEFKISTGPPRKLLVKDENGNMVPEWPEETIPLHELPPDHPAIEYLKNRGFDIEDLETQFEACYCMKEKPESRAEGRYYSRLPGNMRNTHQGRIIFSVRMNGVRWGYQSRYIDKWSNGKYFFWSPEHRWELIRYKDSDGNIVDRFPADKVKFPKGFAPHKYLNSTGAERNKLLMGFDAAVEFNKDKPKKDRFCIIVEGPLDAAKIGPPGIALLGKSMSQNQAKYIQSEFGHVYVMPDNDRAGEQMAECVERMLPTLNVDIIDVPGNVKDVGDLSKEQVKQILKNEGVI